MKSMALTLRSKLIKNLVAINRIYALAVTTLLNLSKQFCAPFYGELWFESDKIKIMRK